MYRFYGQLPWFPAHSDGEFTPSICERIIRRRLRMGSGSALAHRTIVRPTESIFPGQALANSPAPREAYTIPGFRKLTRRTWWPPPVNFPKPRGASQHTACRGRVRRVLLSSVISERSS